MPLLAFSRTRAALLIAFALFTGSPSDAIAAPVLETGGSQTSDTQFTLQIGAYASRAAANDLASAIDGAWIQVVRRGNTAVYRVNVGHFQTRAAAVRVQWQLEDRGLVPAIQPLYA